MISQMVRFFWMPLIWICGVTLFYWAYPIHIPSENALIQNDFDFQAPLQFIGKSVSWKSDGGLGGSGSVKLVSSKSNRPSVQWEFESPKRYQFLKFRGWMRTENLVQGNARWKQGRFVVCFQDKEGKTHWDYPHSVGMMKNTAGWQKFEKVFTVPSFAVTARIILQNAGVSGSMWADDVSVVPLYLNPAYFYWKYIIWIMLASIGVVYIIKFKLYRNYTLTRGSVLLLAGIIIIGVIAPNDYLVSFGEFINTNSYIIGEKSNLLSVKKPGHFVLFAFLSFIVFRNNRNRGGDKWFVFVGLAVFAGTTEILQFTISERTPKVSDWLVDLSGVILGMLIAKKKLFATNE